MASTKEGTPSFFIGYLLFEILPLHFFPSKYQVIFTLVLGFKIIQFKNALDICSVFSHLLLSWQYLPFFFFSQ